MIKYEELSVIALDSAGAALRSHKLPELVHLQDPALAVMSDFSQTLPHTINPDENMDNALNEMKVHGVHVLLVTNADKHVIGILSTEDLLGEKPIKILQHRRIERNKILVNMLMVPTKEIIAFNIEDVEHARVGNIVTTLKNHRQHYALVIKKNEEGHAQTAVGMFSTSQISKQLHCDIASSLFNADSVSELQRRKS